jgi:hypothetical protein
MKILEIIDPEILPDKRYSGEFKTGKYRGAKMGSLSSDDKELGFGHFSGVKASKEDPHQVKKYQRRFTDKEGESTEDKYWKYVNYIIENKLWENPYFPRIYKKQVYSDRKQKRLNTIEMERLDSSISNDEVEFLVNKMFYITEMNSVARRIIENKTDEFEALMVKMVAAALHGSDQVTAYIIHVVELDFKIKDKTFKEAVDHLQKFHKEYNADFDLHKANVMYRRGPAGIQLVFTDPFSF